MNEITGDTEINNMLAELMEVFAAEGTDQFDRSGWEMAINDLDTEVLPLIIQAFRSAPESSEAIYQIIWLHGRDQKRVRELMTLVMLLKDDEHEPEYLDDLLTSIRAQGIYSDDEDFSLPGGTNRELAEAVFVLSAAIHEDAFYGSDLPYSRDTATITDPDLLDLLREKPEVATPLVEFVKTRGNTLTAAAAREYLDIEAPALREGAL